MKKEALRAIARLTHINLREAVMVVRKNPLLGDEIHIEEELVNLEEAVKTYRMAAETLEQYPDMKAEMIREKRLILKHCLGLVIRMIHNNTLPHAYNESDTFAAVKRVVRLVVEDVRKSGVAIDDETFAAIRPFLGWSLRLKIAEKPWTKVGDAMVSLKPYRPVLARLR